MPSKNTDTKNVETRQRIMEAANELFIECGYSETTTLRIAKKAGVNETTIFRNFGSKKNLFQEIFYANMPIINENLLSSLSNGKDLRNDLVTLFKEYITMCIRHIPNYRLSVQQVDEVFDEKFVMETVNYINSTSQQMTSYFEMLKAFGIIRDMDYESVTELLYSVFLVKAPQLLADSETRQSADEIVQEMSERYADFVRDVIAFP